MSKVGLPLSVHDEDGSIGNVFDATGEPFAQVVLIGLGKEAARANELRREKARFIVRACNSHDALVAALAAAKSALLVNMDLIRMRGPSANRDEATNAFAIIDAALSQAKGEGQK